MAFSDDSFDEYQGEDIPNPLVELSSLVRDQYMLLSDFDTAFMEEFGKAAGKPKNAKDLAARYAKMMRIIAAMRKAGLSLANNMLETHDRLLRFLRTIEKAAGSDACTQANLQLAAVIDQARAQKQSALEHVDEFLKMCDETYPPE